MPASPISHPKPFLEIRVDHLDPHPGLLAFCAGYEQGKWRDEQLAGHLMEWLPEFALRYDEWKNLGAHNAVNLMVRAAKTIYASEKFQSRGEFGELLLHVLLRQRFKTVPAISKYFYKDSRNDTVKGFDAVHVVATDTTLELWLGEVKFYDNISIAISHVVKELTEHTERNYLRDEFAAITNKIDDSWQHAERLKKLIHPNTSLDDIFDCVCIPVLLTYNSSAVSSHSQVNDQYKKDFESEVRKHHSTFISKTLPSNVKVHLFLLPLNTKSSLLVALDSKLKKWQSLL